MSLVAEKPIEPRTEEIEPYISASSAVVTDDLDWVEARRIGLTDDERFFITYASDVEYQTVIYMRELLGTDIARDPDALAFLTIWNYEEYFHGRALTRVLQECGYDSDETRIVQVRESAHWFEWLTDATAKVGSLLFRQQFPAVYLTWGSTQEFTTLNAYNQVARLTKNPALREVCLRIAKQERRHFAWYFNGAKQALERSLGGRRLARFALDWFWTPVGVGVRPPQDMERLFGYVFPDDQGRALAREIDAKIGTLPGMAGVTIMRRFLEKTTGPQRLGLGSTMSATTSPKTSAKASETTSERSSSASVFPS